MMLLVGSTFASAAPEKWTAWPPREYLLKSLISGIETVLKSQDPATGRFGTKPWICTDQNVLLPLAAAWSLQDPANPWYHSERLLAAIARGGEALVDDQDPKGRWIFRKKDNSTWGQIYMPWTYSRWVRAYVLVRDALPAEARARWEKGLLLGFSGTRAYMNGGVQNIPAHHAMALYIAGQAFDNADWRDAAKAFMAKVVAEQDPAGFWTEHFGPVVGYNEVYVDALGVYYAFSKDPVVLEALKRSADFHARILWPDGSAVSCIDERQIYHAGIATGTIGFSFTPEGRGYLLQQLSSYAATGALASADYAASMLLCGGSGEGLAPAAAGDRAVSFLGNHDALVQRARPWAWAFSGYACTPLPDNRWIQDRQNFVDLFLDGAGLVSGGGNTRLAPYWSTFTVGDCSLLKQQPGEENPHFTPAIDLVWTPTSAKITTEGEASRLDLKYGEVACSVSARAGAEGLRLTYEAPADKRVEAHLPLLRRAARLTCASGKQVRLGMDEFVLTSAEVGAWLRYGGLQVSVPAGASLRWPARQHDPYKKDGSSGLSAAKLVLCLPFAAGVSRYDLDLAPAPAEVFDGQVFEARDLTARVVGDGYTKRLDDLRSQLLGTKQPGAALAFTLPAVKAGRYELLAEFVTAPMYAIVKVSVDGKVVGEDFDGYCPEVDAEGERVSFGTVELAAGDHEIKVEVTGHNEKSSGYLISVQRWLLRRQ